MKSPAVAAAAAAECNERDKVPHASEGGGAPPGAKERIAPLPLLRMAPSLSPPPYATPPPMSPPPFDVHYSPPPSAAAAGGFLQRVVGIDCEMVGVGPGGFRSALARVTLVDYDVRCLLDTYVKVEEPITDYRTCVSGIGPRELRSAGAIPFVECRHLVGSLIRNKILVGHGLKNDLSVLSLRHPWYDTRDTSLYQPYMRMNSCGRWSSRRLKDLASMHLGISIQEAGIPHDSFDDAAAAMALYRNVRMEWDYAMECKRQTYLCASSPRARMAPPLAQTI